MIFVVTWRETAEAHFASQNIFLFGNPLHCYLLLKRTVCFKLAYYSLLLRTLCLTECLAAWNTLLSNPLCFLEPLTPQHNLLLNTLCSIAHFAPWNTFLPGILCSLEHSAPQPHLLFRTLCFSAHFAPQHTLLLSPLYSITHFATWNTLPERIYNSHYGNGVPAMFTS